MVKIRLTFVTERGMSRNHSATIACSSNK